MHVCNKSRTSRDEHILPSLVIQSSRQPAAALFHARVPELSQPHTPPPPGSQIFKKGEAFSREHTCKWKIVPAHI